MLPTNQAQIAIELSNDFFTVRLTNAHLSRIRNGADTTTPNLFVIRQVLDHAGRARIRGGRCPPFTNHNRFYRTTYGAEGQAFTDLLYGPHTVYLVTHLTSIRTIVGSFFREAKVYLTVQAVERSTKTGSVQLQTCPLLYHRDPILRGLLLFDPTNLYSSRAFR